MGVRKPIVVVLIAVALLVVSMADPGAGTGVNLHGQDDVAALIAGDHHAKPIPDADALRVVELAAVALLVLLVLVTTTAVARVAVAADVTVVGRLERWASVARRGPPALA